MKAIVAAVVWLLAVATFYWITWHCGFGAMGLWCPATLDGDYGMDAGSFANHVLPLGLGVPAMVTIVIVVYRTLRRRSAQP